MKTSAVKYTLLAWVSGLSLLILFLMPFHAFLTVWASSTFGHYTALRLWKEILLLLAGIAALFLVATDHKIRSYTLPRRLIWLILAYAVVNLLWAMVSYRNGATSAKAAGYGLIVDLRFLIFFLITWAVSLRLARLRSHWQWVVVWPAVGVVVFGLLQIVLPHDFLRHFGYGPQTIPAVETINNNAHYVRIASTLRGANPLGAYLLIPISLSIVLLTTKKYVKRRSALLAGSLVVLLFSFSRSAWVGALLSIGVLTLTIHSSKIKNRIFMAAAGIVIVAIGLALGLRHNTHYQNLVFHTQDHSTVQQTSNAGHLTSLSRGFDDIIHQPLGRGPGSAGPASVYNGCGPVRIAENYFIQIGQETGWIGLSLFLLIYAGVGYLLWLRRSDPLALALLASLVGLTFINLLSHAWADDTLAYVWWGLAGIALAPFEPRQVVMPEINKAPPTQEKSAEKPPKKKQGNRAKTKPASKRTTPKA